MIPASEFVFSTAFAQVLLHKVSLEWGVKSITTGDSRDRIATTG